MPSGTYWTYCGVVTVIGVLLLWRTRQRIKSAESASQERLEKLKRFDAVRTESPLDDPADQARGRAHGSVEMRFSLIRATILPALSLVILAFLILPLLGAVPAAVLTLLAAVVGVVVGVAAKPALENFFAGLVISFAKPIRIGDTVLIDELFGTIEDITVTHTIIKAWDWRRLMIPNHSMIGREFVNYSIIDRYQWAYVEFWVSADSDLATVGDIAVNAAKASAQFAGYEEPRFWVMELGKEAIRCWIAAWADTPSAAWQLAHDVRTSLARDLRAAGIKTHAYQHRFGLPVPPTADLSCEIPAPDQPRRQCMEGGDRLGDEIEPSRSDESGERDCGDMLL